MPQLTVAINSLVQVAGTTLQALNLLLGSGYLSPKGQAAVAGGVAAVQGVIGVLAHFQNPDGTPATVGFVKK